MFTKKFKEEEDPNILNNPNIFLYYDYESPVKAKIKIPKEFKLIENPEEEMQVLLKNKKDGKFTCSNKIHDFRFFDVQNFDKKILTFITNENPNEKIMKLLKEISSKIINLDSILKNIKEENFSELSLMEKEVIILDSIINSEEIKNLPVSLQSNPKVIIYLDTEKIDLEIFLILNFIKKLKNSQKIKNIDLILMSDENIIFALEPGMNTIFLSRSLFTKKGLGLLPIEQSVISTKGLEWDVTNWKTNYGSNNLSTSNEFKDDESKIIVETGSIVITTEIDPENIVFL